MHHLNLQYNCLHDPHLQDYHKRKDILRMLKKQGCVTRENKVICTVKEFNEYRQYLTRTKVQSEQILGQQEISKETARKSGRFRRVKMPLYEGQTNSTAKLGEEDASRAADSQQKPDNTADSLFKAVFEQLTAAEVQKLQELVETVVYKVFGRLKVPWGQHVKLFKERRSGDQRKCFRQLCENRACRDTSRPPPGNRTGGQGAYSNSVGDLGGLSGDQSF
ncbi:uncharacterized protein LOC143695387 [Agelaius phoeniceus]|uniref:uncharacterized protein LOC143695387 n=1 Tax=Agelaius phoeniceus TaxID=39638 RepID=UPI004054C53B